MSVEPSRTSSPLSATSTLISSPSPELKWFPDDAARENRFKKLLIPSSHTIELIASRATLSSTVYVYDLAEQVGFGTLIKAWSGSDDHMAPIISMQTRAGAGLSLVGRLTEGTSQDTEKGAVLTAFTTPAGLSAMAQSLSYLPAATNTSRLVLQVPTLTSFGDTFALSPSTASLGAALAVLPRDVVVLLSATPQESVDLTSLSYKLTSAHVIHLFDHYSATRELGRVIVPSLPSKGFSGLSVPETIRQSGYNFFDYAGDKEARTVVVVLNGPLALAAKAYAAEVSGLGVIVVRVIRPWDESALREILPHNVQQVHVLDDVPNSATQGTLYADVFGSLYNASAVGPTIRTHRITPKRTHEFVSHPLSFRQFLLSLVPGIALTLASPTNLKKLLFFSTPGTALRSVPLHVEDMFLSTESISARLLSDSDVFSKPGGITASRLIVGPKDNSNAYLPIDAALPLVEEQTDFLGVLDHSILKTHNILKYAKCGSVVLVATSWSASELLSNLPSETLSIVRDRALRICVIDAKGLASKFVSASGHEQETFQNVLVHLAFLRLYLGKAATEQLVYKVAKTNYGDIIQGIQLTKLVSELWGSLVEVVVPTELLEAEAAAPPAALKMYEFNAIAVETDDGETVVNGARLSSWHDAAKHLIFPSIFTPPSPPSSEEYPSNPSLRPEVPDRTFLVTTTVNRRLTPLEYDRNVFHLEFDTSGTGLKYAIGEALGVHGWNDERDVLDFCTWYGADPDRLITIPVIAGDTSKWHTRTVFQTLQQQIDLFGRPPKSFYTDLAPYATSEVDKYALRFIGSPEGSATFKKMSEIDTVTFVDVLQKYASARPGIEVLCELVGDIKPRHYSIASAQSVVGDRVDLLVVTVDWVTPSGSPRFGQCTRYLADLKVGQKVTVSIKPSVMKLPPNNSQPIIMAGLGTGAAPFRAFLQHRALLAQQGHQVGPTYYYFGSRYQSAEYLYGEEIEAYILDGTITKAGLAFSRDGKKKVYIQHLMLEDAERLAGMLRDEEGVFYLCGPTWPVPDVYEALVGALGKYKGMEAGEAGAFLEGLKEEERYVLEVY